ncbi:MAG: hypothetical protein AAGD06_01895 [Acidobacteriota bacterium]
MDDPPTPVPTQRAGLVLFPPGTSARHRRRRCAFVAVWLGVVAMLTWPVYPRFADSLPRILGLPLSFAWVILALAVMFGALLLLFLTEEDTDRGGEG